MRQYQIEKTHHRRSVIALKALVNGRILMPTKQIDNRVLLFDRQVLAISETIPDGCEIIDAKGRYVSPGLIDVHIHGYMGADASDGTLAGLCTMAEGILKNGVTSILPTTMTIPWEQLEQAFQTIRLFMQKSKQPGFQEAQALGCHAEGPFINPKRKGAQAESAITEPEAKKLMPYMDIIRLLTVAPEMPGAFACIEQIKDKIRVSIGHTDADYDTTVRALEAGADHFTHTFNAMTGLNHRNPGVVGAALASDAYCELIADTFHVNKGMDQLNSI